MVVMTDQEYFELMLRSKKKKKNGQQTEASPEEKAVRAEEMRTQGRKGCKAKRINMAFTSDNHEFLRVISKASGRTMSWFCNYVIASYRNSHPELLQNAREFAKVLK